MKLTNFLRNAFVNAVMADVPTVDYKSQIRKLVLDDAVAALPPAVHAVWEDRETAGFVNRYFGVFGGAGVSYPAATERNALSPNVHEKVEALEKQARLQTDARNELLRKLSGVARSVTSRKALAAALPEFAKYLPAEDAPDRSLPVLAGVVEEFKRAGWK